MSDTAQRPEVLRGETIGKRFGAVTALDDLTTYDVGVYLVRAALDPADAALLSNGFRVAAAEGRYSALLRETFVHPRWALDGVEFVEK